MFITSHMKVSAGEGKWRIEGEALRCGKDIQCVFTGGEAPHIGATALALPRPSLNDPKKTSASASVICVTGHKDDQLAREAALKIAAACNAAVCVTVGIHVDNATAADLDLLNKNFSEAANNLTGLLLQGL